MRLRQVCGQSPQAGRAEAGATERATQERIRAELPRNEHAVIHIGYIVENVVRNIPSFSHLLFTADGNWWVPDGQVPPQVPFPDTHILPAEEAGEILLHPDPPSSAVDFVPPAPQVVVDGGAPVHCSQVPAQPEQAVKGPATL